MAPPKGNQFWKARSTHGRKPIFKTPEELWSASCEYFQWVENNPLWEEKLFSYMGEVTRDTIYKMRAMTISGMCLFLDISEDTWANYRRKQDFTEVCTQVENVIYNQKFAGAAADLLNGNIIARDLGLRDRQEINLSSGDTLMRVLQESEADDSPGS